MITRLQSEQNLYKNFRELYLTIIQYILHYPGLDT